MGFHFLCYFQFNVLCVKNRDINEALCFILPLVTPLLSSPLLHKGQSTPEPRGETKSVQTDRERRSIFWEGMLLRYVFSLLLHYISHDAIFNFITTSLCTIHFASTDRNELSSVCAVWNSGTSNMQYVTST